MKGLRDWINTQPNGADENELKRIWDATASYKKGYSPNVDEGHDLFMRKIFLDQKTPASIIPLKRNFGLWRVAAMIVFLVAAGMLFDHFVGSTTDFEKIGTSSSQTKELNLVDGTIVILNELSSIDFPAIFENDQRMVKLTGEAFFDVARDESKPFKIETPKAIIEVLGTSFNVRSYPNENFMEVFVKTGSVKVRITGDASYEILSPGELLRFDFEKSISEKINDESAENVIAWKSGKLNFKNRPMGEIFKALERHYRVTFKLEDARLKDCLFTFNSNTDKIEDALEGLEAACNLIFTKKENKVFEVHGSCCE